MRLACFMVVAPLAMTSQTVSPGVVGSTVSHSASTAQTTTPTKELASIEGQVVDALTGAPIRKANLTLRRVDATPSQSVRFSTYGTVSDSGGTFAMKDIEPGKYQLSVSRTGFLTTSYGARGPNRPGSQLSLSPGQQLKELNIRLTRHGVITGRILDEDGEPVAGVQVQLQTHSYFMGRKQLAPANGSGTNDLGEFRIYGLAPGKYYLTAIFRSSGAIDRSATPQADEDYVPTYYPGTIDLGRAVPLEVTAGGQLSNLTFSLSRARTVRISGRVMNLVSERGRPVVMLLPRNGLSSGVVANRLNPVDGTGRFEIRGAVPGSYWLSASFNQGNMEYSVRQPIEVGNTNIENVTLSIGTGAQVTGSVRIDGESSASLGGIRVSLQLREPSIIRSAPPPASTLKDDASFELSHVPPDEYNLSFSGLPEGFYVESVRSSGTDLLASGMDLTSGGPIAVEVVLSPRAAQITGIVQNPNTQQPAPAATIVLIPKENDRRDQQTYYKAATTDQTGAFTLKSVVPGEYTAYAWEDIEPGAYMDPDFVKPFESAGQHVSVPESGRLTLQLSLITVDQVKSQ